jgi:hypothetical protein
MQFKKVPRKNPTETAETSVAMDIDHPSTASAAIPVPLKTPEIEVLSQSTDIQELSKPEKIKVLVRQHVALWKKCKEASLAEDLTPLRQLFTDAQESQKVLQKLISNKEIEGYVQGWNPWTEKRLQFTPAEKYSGKAKRETQSDKRKSYNNPRKWEEISEMIQAAKGLYDSTD